MLTAGVVLATVAGAVLLVLFARRRNRQIPATAQRRQDTPGARLDRIRRAGL
jgi:hypothetical protein